MVYLVLLKVLGNLQSARLTHFLFAKECVLEHKHAQRQINEIILCYFKVKQETKQGNVEEEIQENMSPVSGRWEWESHHSPQIVVYIPGFYFLGGGKSGNFAGFYYTFTLAKQIIKSQTFMDL